MSDLIQTLPDDEPDFEFEAAAHPSPADAPPREPAMAPVRLAERIGSVDVLRGISLLGILLLNINSFGLPIAAYTDPTAYGGARGANLAVWMINHVLIEGKMRAIFCMLGASVIIMTSRAQRRGAGAEIADIYYRRTLWLAVFGMIHGYLIWFGDILFHLGIVGLVVFPFRKLSGRMLCLIGAALLAVHTVQTVRGEHHYTQLARTVAGYEAIERSGKTLTPQQRAQIQDAYDTRNNYKPDAATIDRQIQTTRSGYLENLKARAHTTASWHSGMFYRFIFLDVAGMLLLGMGLMKLGILDASRSFRFYAWMAVIGYGIGLPLDIALSTMWVRSNFDLAAMFNDIRAPGDLIRLSTALGHIAVIMIICKAGAFRQAAALLAGVGRMALTNYLLTSVLCTLFFYGYGLEMFARLQRVELLYVVAVVWTINLALSALWLKHFRFGPLEWLWRSLTYAKIQPMRVEPAD